MTTIWGLVPNCPYRLIRRPSTYMGMAGPPVTLSPAGPQEGCLILPNRIGARPPGFPPFSAGREIRGSVRLVQNGGHELLREST